MGRCPRINPYRSRAASTDTTRTTDTHRENTGITSQQHHETILCFWAFLTQRPSVTKEVLIKTKFSHWTEPDGHEWCKIFPMIHFSPFRLVCQFCGFVLKAATDKSFLCVSPGSWSHSPRPPRTHTSPPHTPPSPCQQARRACPLHSLLSALTNRCHRRLKVQKLSFWIFTSYQCLWY